MADEIKPRPLAEGVEIREARVEDADGLLPLLRGYCDHYEVDPPDSGLLELARTVAGDPDEGGRGQGSAARAASTWPRRTGR